MRIIQIIKQILSHRSVEPCRAKDRKIKGASGAIFSSAHYYVNADGFIACRIGGAIRGRKGKMMLIQNLKRFFEVKAGIERIEEQIKELKEDKKSYLETLENLERELKRELNTDDLTGVQISHGLNMSIEVVKKEDKEAGNE